ADPAPGRRAHGVLDLRTRARKAAARKARRMVNVARTGADPDADGVRALSGRPEAVPVRMGMDWSPNRERGGPRSRFGPSRTLAQLDRHRLRPRVMLQCRLAVFAALARHLEPAEWRRCVHDVVTVHPDRSGLHSLGISVRLVHVLRPDAGRETVVG